jgi:hypothetical protein
MRYIRAGPGRSGDVAPSQLVFQCPRPAILKHQSGTEFFASTIPLYALSGRALIFHPPSPTWAPAPATCLGREGGHWALVRTYASMNAECKKQ